MRNHWQLPGEDILSTSPVKWFQRIVEDAPAHTVANFLLITWRIWFCRNEFTHQKPMPSVTSSRIFLIGYRNLLRDIKSVSTAEIIKGKGPMLLLDAPPEKIPEPAPTEIWRKPDDGWIKLSIDGSYSVKDGRAGTGMVVRGDDGSVLFMACRALPNCKDPLEAEFEACLEGLRKTRRHSQLPLTVESDSALLVEAVNSPNADRSSLHSLVNDIRHVISMDNNCVVLKVSRTQVRVSDALANFARSQDRTMTWLGSGPECALRLLDLDNSVTLPVG
jgi:ribonuclease HI